MNIESSSLNKVQENSSPKLNSVHGIEDGFMHDVDLHADILTELCKLFLEACEVAALTGNINHHYHDEHLLKDRLVYVKDICLVFAANCANLCKNADSILTDYCDYCSHCFSLLKYNETFYHKIHDL